MRIQEFSLYEATLTLTVSTPRPEGTPSHIIPGAKLHDEIAAQVRGLLREYKHIAPTAARVAPAATIGTYLPTASGAPLYHLRALEPAGSLIEVNEDFMLDLLRLRWAASFVLAPGFFAAAEGLALAFEENWQRAFQGLLTANGVAQVFIPGDEDRRPGDRTEIDLILELGAASARLGYDIAG